jgi:hypothetical protein
MSENAIFVAEIAKQSTEAEKKTGMAASGPRQSGEELRGKSLKR